MTAKKTDKPAEKAAPARPAETWQLHWNVSRRLLEMRRQLRGTKLWATFEIQRSFEAFSIHVLANAIEEAATDCGLISSFRVTKWEKQGNRTVVEGMVTFENVDDGEIREYPGVGESIDNSDKGLHKADSDARKVALINALNLGIGTDKEASNEKPEAAGPAMGGAPQQTKRPNPKQDASNAYIHPQPASNGAGTHPAAPKMYTLQQHGVKARAVLGSGMRQTCWSIILNSPTTDAVTGWLAMNEDMLRDFQADLPDEAVALNKVIQARLSSLREKGI